jgi:hypothetical protein
MKDLTTIAAELQAKADHAYCDYIKILSRDE